MRIYAVLLDEFVIVVGVFHRLEAAFGYSKIFVVCLDYYRHQLARAVERQFVKPFGGLGLPCNRRYGYFGRISKPLSVAVYNGVATPTIRLQQTVVFVDIGAGNEPLAVEHAR